jgi:lactoylglutathione lyase
MISFAYTIVYVTDVEKTISFYEKAFGFKRKFIAPENEYGELDTGATTLSFASLSLAKKNLPDGFIESSIINKPFGMEIAFATKDVKEVYNAAIKAGAIAVAPAQTKPWGQTVAYVRDIDGVLIEICTPIE